VYGTSKPLKKYFFVLSYAEMEVYMKALGIGFGFTLLGALAGCLSNLPEIGGAFSPFFYTGTIGGSLTMLLATAQRACSAAELL
jgi:hypothetical protein